jgi:hypothetical protein
MWTMPRRTLWVVAILIALCAVTGFYMGFSGTPGRARLPGEEAGAGAAPLAATDARPLTEAAEAPPPPPPEKAEEKDEEDSAEEETPPEKLTVEAPPLAVPAPTPAPAPPPAPAEDRVGDLLDGVTPPPQDAPIF